VLLVEGLQAPIWTDLADHKAVSALVRSTMDAFDSDDQLLETGRIIDPMPEVDPHAGAQERRQNVGIELVRCAGQEDRKEPEVGILGGAILGDVELFAMPVSETVRPVEDSTRPRGP
jgi:hypothetical protein